MKTKKLEILCRFCKEKGGEIEVADPRAECLFQISERENNIKNLEVEFDVTAMTPQIKTDETLRRQNLIATATKEIAYLKQLLVTYPEKDPRHDIDYHVEDHRCDKCQEEHGNYKEMSLNVMSHRLPYSTFKEIMEKTGHKKHQLDEHIISYKNKS